MSTKEDKGKNSAAKSRMRKKGITRKLAGAIIVTIVIMVAALLFLVYNRVSDTLLNKSENLLKETTDKALQETSAWMNKTLTMLEMYTLTRTASLML